MKCKPACNQVGFLCISSPMELAEWMALKGLKDAALAEKVASTQTTISRVRRGLVMPEASLMERLMLATEWQVTPNDLFAKYTAGLTRKGRRGDGSKRPRVEDCA